LKEHAKGVNGSREVRTRMLIDPLSSESPIRCPNYFDIIYAQKGS
jgi:hypothetical protein